MEFALPKIGKAPIPFPHFPTKHQAFIFRAYEYCTPEKIAACEESYTGQYLKKVLN